MYTIAQMSDNIPETIAHNENENTIVEEPTVLDDQFNIILKTLGDFKTQITV